MYVRTIYSTGDPAKLDGVAEALSSEGRRLLSEQPGFRGMGLFVDRDLGKLLIGSWWEDEESRDASFERLSERRSELLAPFARTVAVDNWEAPVARRAESPGPDARFRWVRMELDPSDVDLLVDTFKNIALPKIEGVPGLAGTSLLVDRARGRAAVGALFDDQASLAASRGTLAEVRGETTSKARVVTRSLEEFEVVLTTVVPRS
ncbi:antibiotic biosynthesis monooxygenase [Streptomyces sp. NPDC015346]|uniref:antibiotic biosynthesis monooxygenase n=1 Tax=Streptomyces sp. NPDC015346 TaxID=3364954 RepID=UPI003701D6AA